ncbi:MAG TPA: hypothetical protein VFV79_06235, partial [Saprospiraceae bacterium]|nr:hypothetical protein [Saprospiraceae bacterium]
RSCITICFLTWISIGLHAQPILIDEGITINGLICFPVYGDSLSWRYLPTDGHLSISDEGLPEFSFLRFAKVNESSGPQSISEADGGGLVHFLVLYDTPPNLIAQAESGLRMKLKQPKLQIKGPVLFSKGDYVVISSILKDGKEEKQLIGTGKAPVFENSKVAFSFMLNVLDAQLLMESFKMATPDVSIMFQLIFSGLTQSYDAEVEMNWSEVQKSEYYHEKTNALFYSSEVTKSFAELHRTGALKIHSAGKDSLMEGMLDIAYEKLLNLMFNPIAPNAIPDQNKKGFMEEIFGPGGALTLGFGYSNTYVLRELKADGKTVISLNKRSEVQRSHMITFNIGNIYEKFGKDKRIFRDVVIDDPAFQQRDVRIGIDGDLQNAFENFVKNASVSLRKAHENGKETLREVFINQSTLKEQHGEIKMTYLNQEDKDRLNWLNYEYQVIWNFGAEGTYNTGWVKTNSPIINLYAPYKRYVINLDGDLEKLKAENVRAVSIRIAYDFFGKAKEKQITIRTNEVMGDKFFDITLPSDQRSVKYEITWMKNDGSAMTFKGIDEYGLIFIDEEKGS